MFIEQKIAMEKRGWTAAVFLLVSFQLDRNAQREYQQRLMVPVCCHLIAVRLPLVGILSSPLLSSVTSCACQCAFPTSVLGAQVLALKKLKDVTPLSLNY